jgi:hypothetical protein
MYALTKGLQKQMQTCSLMRKFRNENSWYFSKILKLLCKTAKIFSRISHHQNNAKKRNNHTKCMIKWATFLYHPQVEAGFQWIISSAKCDREMREITQKIFFLIQHTLLEPSFFSHVSNYIQQCKEKPAFAIKGFNFDFYHSIIRIWRSFVIPLPQLLPLSRMITWNIAPVCTLNTVIAPIIPIQKQLLILSLSGHFQFIMNTMFSERRTMPRRSKEFQQVLKKLMDKNYKIYIDLSE